MFTSPRRVEEGRAVSVVKWTVPRLHAAIPPWECLQRGRSALDVSAVIGLRRGYATSLRGAI